MKYKLGFLKLRFLVEKGSKKERIIKFIISIENTIKRYFVKILSRNKRHIVSINNENFCFQDILFSCAWEEIVKEIRNDIYGFNKIIFKEGDIVIDIGANIGIASIYLSKKYPFLKIYSFEPFEKNFKNFVKNIEINNIGLGRIHPFNKAVTCDARDIIMKTEDILNSGSFSIDFKKKFDSDNKNIVKSTTLDKIIEIALKENKKNTIKLLKIDCELSEYEILKNTKIENLQKIENLAGEFHEKQDFDGNADELETFIRKYIPNVKITRCKLD